jgi:hypothetical protein
MPIDPNLPLDIVPGVTSGHAAASSVVHSVLNGIYKFQQSGATKIAAYTLQQSDQHSLVVVNSTSSVPITLPVLQSGTRTKFLRQGTGAVTFTASGTTLFGPSGSILTPAVQGSIIEILYLTTTDVWFSGDITNEGLSNAQDAISDLDNRVDDVETGKLDVNVRIWTGTAGTGTWGARPSVPAGFPVMAYSVLDVAAPPPPDAVAGDLWFTHPDAV